MTVYSQDVIGNRDSYKHVPLVHNVVLTAVAFSNLIRNLK